MDEWSNLPWTKEHQVKKQRSRAHEMMILLDHFGADRDALKKLFPNRPLLSLFMDTLERWVGAKGIKKKQEFEKQLIKQGYTKDKQEQLLKRSQRLYNILTDSSGGVL